MGRDLALMGFAAARGYRRGLADAVRGARPALATRRPLSPLTARRMRCIRALKPATLRRVARRVRERLI